MKRHHVMIGILTSFCIVFPVLSLMAEGIPDTVRVAGIYSTGREGSLNRAVQTAIAAGNLSNTVFLLGPNDCYILTHTIQVPAGEHLTITAPEPGSTQDTAPPQILWTADQDVNTRYTFQCFGDVHLENLWLVYGNTVGSQIQTSLIIEDNPEANAEGKGENAIFEGVIFDYSGFPAEAGGAVTVTAGHFRGTFSNCYFRNCTDPHFRYYGRAVSYPFNSYGWHTDSVLFENCTFANMGYVYMQEGGWSNGQGNYADWVRFNHCTFVNIVMFPLESGFWRELSVTHSVFVNTQMTGVRPVDYRWMGNDSYGGTMMIDSTAAFGFEVPFTDSERHILFTHSSYAVEDWLKEWMENNPESVYHRMTAEDSLNPFPEPMLNRRTLAFFDRVENGEKAFPFMNRAALYDSTDPGFILAPTDTANLKTFLYYKWCCGNDQPWAWKPENTFNQIWPLEENLAYTNSFLKTASLGGFPLGDLYHWYPDEYREWNAQKDAETARIDLWLETGQDPGPLPSAVRLSESPLPRTRYLNQNFPNPFNPSTVIRYTIPRAGFVSLKLYDIRGRAVTVLVEGTASAGEFQATLDADGLASGIYILRLEAEGVSETRKVVAGR